VTTLMIKVTRSFSAKVNLSNCENVDVRAVIEALEQRYPVNLETAGRSNA